MVNKKNLMDRSIEMLKMIMNSNLIIGFFLPIFLINVSRIINKMEGINMKLIMNCFFFNKLITFIIQLYWIFFDGIQ